MACGMSGCGFGSARAGSGPRECFYAASPVRAEQIRGVREKEKRGAPRCSSTFAGVPGRLPTKKHTDLFFCFQLAKKKTRSLSSLFPILPAICTGFFLPANQWRSSSRKFPPPPCQVSHTTSPLDVFAFSLRRYSSTWERGGAFSPLFFLVPTRPA